MPLSVRLPVSDAPEVGNVYVPGSRVKPPRSAATSGVAGVEATASLYAVRQSASALQAAVPLADVVPVHTPGPNPVMAVPLEISV